jgi:Histidine kinase-, DNA gyrase B-, and HSP90-like ATPase
MTRPRQSYMQPTTPLVAVQAFIDATRDSGYKSTGSAIAELIDNALEADAKNIQVNIEESASEQNQPSFLVRVTDDGAGMPPNVLRLALQFGGSTRFGSRVATGRYGMGLPNGGLSQARRIEVVSWTKPSQIWRSYLDADEISAGEVRTLPPPRVVGYAQLSSTQVSPRQPQPPHRISTCHYRKPRLHADTLC